MSTFAPRASLGMFALRISAGAEPTLLDAIHDVHITNICLVDPAEKQEREGEEASSALNKATATATATATSTSTMESAKATKAVVRLHRTFLPGFQGDGFGLEDESDEEEEEDDDDDDDDDDGGKDTAEEEDEASEQVKVANDEDEEDEEEDDEDDDDDDEEEEEFEEESFAVCHLYPGKTEQAQVSLRFTSDDLVGFSVSGGWAIDIIGSYEASPDGYDLSPDEEEDLYSDDDDEDDEEIDSDEAGSLPDLKRRIGRKADEEEEDEDDDDEELDLDSDDLAALMAEEDDEDDEDLDEYDSEASRSDEEDAAGRFTELVEEAPTRASKKRALSEVDVDDSMDVSTAAEVTQAELQRAAKEAGLDADLSKLSKNQKKRLNKKLKAAAAAAPGQEAQDVQVDAKVAQVQKLGQEPAVVKQTAMAATTPAVNAKAAVKDVKTATQQIKKTKLPSGLEIEDRKVGSGPAAKTGNRIGMRYIGKLLSGKTFDQNTKGKPFNFKLGRGEVIKGWDEGIKGMQVGGERRITIPPALAYGKRGAPPDIPPNATLVFDVKAVEIK